MDLVFAPSQIETWPIDRLRPYVRNAKVHGDDQVAKIAASMAKFGWTVPCLVADDGELIAGHGRVMAATLLGLSDVPVIRLGHLDEAERRAYRIADNKLTEMGDWDEALLRDEIAGLLADDFDLSLLGISDDDLEALLRDRGDDERHVLETLLALLSGDDDLVDGGAFPPALLAMSGRSQGEHGERGRSASHYRVAHLMYFPLSAKPNFDDARPWWPDDCSNSEWRPAFKSQSGQYSLTHR